MNEDQRLGFWTFAISIGVLFLLYLGFVFGHEIGKVEALKPVPRGIEHHAKHTEMKPIHQAARVKVVICGQCGIVFSPEEAGITMDWDKFYRENSR